MFRAVNSNAGELADRNRLLGSRPNAPGRSYAAGNFHGARYS
jgi:hypothetical protein